MKYLLISFIAVILSSCSGNDKTELNKEQVRKEVSEMLSNYHEAIRRGGLMAESDYLDNSSDFFWVPPGYESTLDYDSVRSILTKNALAQQSIDFSWETLEIYPLTNEISSFTGVLTGVMIDTSGVKANIRMIESGTAIKRADRWKLLNGQSAVIK